MSASERSDRRRWDALAACARALSEGYGPDDVDEVVCDGLLDLLAPADAAGAAVLQVCSGELVSVRTTGLLAAAELTVPLSAELLSSLTAGRLARYPGGLAALRFAASASARQRPVLLAPVLRDGRLLRVLAATWAVPGAGGSAFEGALGALAATASIAYAAHPQSWAEDLVHRSPDPVLLLAHDSSIRIASRGLLQLLGADGHALVGLPVVELAHPDDAERVLTRLNRAGTEGTEGTAEPFEFRCRGTDGTWVPVEAAPVMMLGAAGVCGIVVRMRDLRERNALEAELSYWARHDPRTGLANRMLLVVRLREAAVSAAAHGRSLLVVSIRVDGLRDLSATFGQDAADLTLGTVAERFRACVRDTDTVARIGDAEFAIVAVGHAESAESLLQRVGDALREPVPVGPGRARLRAQVGVRTVNPADAATDTGPEQLLRDAELAMHARGETNTADVRYFHPDMQRDAELQQLAHTELAAAVQQGQLVLYYQPIVALASRETVGVEALVRWQHPARGLIPPDAFIPLAERSGVIVQLGAWAMQRACADAVRLRAAGRADLVVSVNVSPVQLDSDDIVGLVGEALNRNRLEPSALCVEITESALARGGAVVDRLRRLRALGTHMALDDFGTGYASYGQLQTLPLDTMKIDRSFVAGLARAEPAPALAREMIRTGRSLGLRIIAEGVETAEQERQLAGLGCPLGQGYLFGRPAPLPEALARLRAERSRLGVGLGPQIAAASSD